VKKVLIAGGTGFLGYHAAQTFLENNWDVTAVGLPPGPKDGLFPPSVEIQLLNLDDTPDAELLKILARHEAVVFAAGLDDRYTPKRPAYPKFHKANVASPTRFLTLAQQAGVSRAVVLGSYFAYFNRIWPELRLAERHPYIRSRVEQEKAVTSIPGLQAMVLELPYIFGSLPVEGWRPLWQPLIRYIRSSRLLFYMRGGTACITARTTGKAVFAAILQGKAGECYPIGQQNLTWTALLGRLASADGRRVKVITLPTGLIRLSMQAVSAAFRAADKESGLNLRYFHALQTAETYLDPSISRQALGYELDDLDLAFRETVKACSR
jgi:dihydroflavonol-4-reductase